MDALVAVHTAFEQGKLDEAYDLARQVTLANSSNAEVFAWLGQICQAQLNYEEALQHYQKAVELQPDNSAYQYQVANIFMLQDKYEQAEAGYRQVYEKREIHDAWLPCNLGRALLYLGKNKEAIPFLQEAIDMDDRLAEAHGAMGRALTESKRFSEAEDFYQKAIKLEPRHFIYHHDLGDNCLLGGKYETAVSAYRRAIELNPSYLWSYRNLGNALSILERWNEAIEVYQEAIDQYPEQAFLYRELGVAQEKIGDTAGEIINYRKALSLDTNQPAWIYWKLAHMLQQQGKLEESISVFKEAMRLGQTSVKSYLGIGEALAKQEKWEEVIALYEEAIRLYPEQADLYRNLGFAQEQVGDFDKEVISYQKAVDLAEQPIWVYPVLVDLLRYRARFKEAISACQKGLKIFPEDKKLLQQFEQLQQQEKIKGNPEIELPSKQELHRLPLEDDKKFLFLDKYETPQIKKANVKKYQKRKHLKGLTGFPPDLILPPLTGEGNDYTFIEGKLQDLTVSARLYTLTTSIIIPVYTCKATVAKILAALTHQTYPKKLFEVVIVNAGNNTELEELIQPYRQYFDVTIVHSYNQRILTGGAAYNLGISAAKYDYVITFDYDLLPAPELVEQFMKYFHVTDKAVLIGNRRFIDATKVTDGQILNDAKCFLDLPDVPSISGSWKRSEDKKDRGWQLKIYEQSSYLKKDRYPFRAFISCNAAFPKHLIGCEKFYDEEFQHCGYQDKEFGYRLFNAGYYFIPVLSSVGLHQDPSSNRGIKNYREDGRSAEKMFEQRCPVNWYRKYKPGATYQIPKVSIYIPSYNNGKFIKEAVDSALNQTYSDLEVCICDDGSTDDTLYVLEQHFQNNPRVRWVSQKNGGIGKASNAAVRLCRGLYIGQLDSDDLLKPNAVETLVAYLDNNNVGCVYSSCERIDTEGNYIQDEYSYPDFSREKMLLTSIVHHFRMFKRCSWLRTDGFDENLVNAVDYDMFLKLSEVCSFHHIEKNLYLRRWHGKNTSIVNEVHQDRNTHVVQTYALHRMGLSNEWEVYAPNPEQPRRVGFRRKQEMTHIFFFPDYRKSNVYQDLLYSKLPDNCTLYSGDIEDAVEALRDGLGKVVFHLHWINYIFRQAETHEQAARLKNQFLKKLIDFLHDGGKLIWTIHNAVSHDSLYVQEEVQLQNVIASLAHKIHIHSEASIPEIQKHFYLPLDKVDVIHHGNYLGVYPNWIDRQTARCRFKFSPEEIVFLFIGQIRQYKGLDDLVNAFTEVQKQCPTARLLIAGKPLDDFNLESLVLDITILDKITMVKEFIPDEELQFYFNAADAVVLPYRKVLTSGSMLNAMSFGRPVVVPRVGMIEEVVEDEYNGFLYEIGNIESLTKAMLKFATLKISDKEIFFQRVIQSIKHLTWSETADRLFFGI